MDSVLEYICTKNRNNETKNRNNETKIKIMKQKRESQKRLKQIIIIGKNTVVVATCKDL